MQESAKRHPTLLSLPQFAERHPAFTVGSLRWLRFRSVPVARSRVADGKRIKEQLEPNGFGSAFVHVGGRVYVDENEFFRIVAHQNGRSEAAS